MDGGDFRDQGFTIANVARCLQKISNCRLLVRRHPKDYRRQVEMQLAVDAKIRSKILFEDDISPKQTCFLPALQLMPW